MAISRFLLFSVLAATVFAHTPLLRSPGDSRLGRNLQNDPACSPPQLNDVITCYARFLALYDLQVEQKGFRSVLPHFSRLSYRILSSPLHQVCSTWSTVESCLGPISLMCINLSAFNQITWTGKDAVQYVQNHGFLEYTCGPGNALFTANEACLSRSLSASPLSIRIQQCGGRDPLSPDPGYYCANALTTLSCVRNGMLRECGQPAASAICHASAQIARRIGDVDGLCLPQMEQTCTAAALSLLLPLALAALFRSLFP